MTIWVWALAFLVVSYFIYSGVKYTRMIGRIFTNLVYNAETEFTSSSQGEKITILVSSDREIEILFVEKKDSRKIAVFCHESGAAKESWEKYASFLPSLGYHVLSVDFKNSHPSRQRNAFSQWPTNEDVEKLTAVIRWAKKAFRPDVEIILFGVSNGADIAFAASFKDECVRAVVADGLFSMKEIFRDYIRKWAPILVKPNFFGQSYPAWVVNLFAAMGFWHCQRGSQKKFVDIEPLLKKRHVPLLLIHGAQDDYVPLLHQKFLVKLNHGQSVLERFTVEGAGHNEAVIKDERAYETRVSEFLKKF